MSSKAEKERQKQIQDKCQNLLMQMLKDDDNKYCVDCDAKGKDCKGAVEFLKDLALLVTAVGNPSAAGFRALKPHFFSFFVLVLVFKF